MKNDPFYLSKDKSLEASLGVLSVDGNFKNSIAFFYFFVNLKLGTNRAFVGGDCHHTIINPIFKTESWLFFIPNIGAMAIAPYGDTNA